MIAQSVNYLTALYKPAGPDAAYAGTLSDYMITRGKPAIVAEVGTGDPAVHDKIVPMSVRGVFNVMKDMGMYPGKPILPKSQWIIKSRALNRPNNGGMFYPVVGAEYLNTVSYTHLDVYKRQAPLCVQRGCMFWKAR